MRKDLFSLVGLTLFSAFLCVSNIFLTKSSYLTFSDAAKFADVARNIVSVKEYGSKFAFFSNLSLPLSASGLFSAARVSPLIPLTISIAFKLFGVTDQSVIIISALFYCLIAPLTYLLARNYFGRLVGLLSAISVAANPDLLQYGVTGAAEPLFICELIAALILFSPKNKFAHGAALVILLAMYFTRPQAPLYIVPILVFAYILHYYHLVKPKIQLVVLICVGLVFLPIAISKSDSFLIASLHYSSLLPANMSLRLFAPPQLGPVTVSVLVKKIFYNLYNFYKLLPAIISPYLAVLFIISLFTQSKTKAEKYLKMLTLVMTILAFISTAVLVPFFRYIHPVIPFVYIFSVAAFIKVLKRPTVSIFVIVFLTVGQTFGLVFLDSRALSHQYNRNQPPSYVLLSQFLRDHTSSSDTIVTNLDTWGSWYGERKTIWFPLMPQDLTLSPVPIDAIFLTSYLIDDENYYMGQEWRQAFESPHDLKDPYLISHYHYVDSIQLSADAVHEKQSVKGLLFIRNTNNE